MSRVKKFFQKIFGGGGPSVICMKGSNNLYYKAVKEQGAWVPSGAGYASCEECKAATGATGVQGMNSLHVRETLFFLETKQAYERR